MRNIIIAGVSALALTVTGCSMFHSRSSEQANRNAQPSYTQNEMSGTSSAPTSSSRQARTSQSFSEPSQAGMNASADEVKQAQQKLKDDGEYKGAIDGIAGKQTMAALKQFQQKNGLQQTGKLDSQTADKLGVGSMSNSGSSTAPSQQDQTQQKQQ